MASASSRLRCKEAYLCLEITGWEIPLLAASTIALSMWPKFPAPCRFPELRTVGMCKRSCHIVRGRTYSLKGLKDLKHLRSLTLRDLAGPRAGLDLSELPACEVTKTLHVLFIKPLIHISREEKDLYTWQSLPCCFTAGGWAR